MLSWHINMHKLVPMLFSQMLSPYLTLHLFILGIQNWQKPKESTIGVAIAIAIGVCCILCYVCIHITYTHTHTHIYIYCIYHVWYACWTKAIKNQIAYSFRQRIAPLVSKNTVKTLARALTQTHFEYGVHVWYCDARGSSTDHVQPRFGLNKGLHLLSH